MRDISAPELESALYKAFVDHRADSILITSRRQAFQIESAAYGVEKGWLHQTIDDSDEQSTAWIFRLTEAGKQHFGLVREATRKERNDATD